MTKCTQSYQASLPQWHQRQQKMEFIKVILKGVWHEIFEFRFFHESVSHWPRLSYCHFEFLRKFAEIFTILCVVDTDGKLFTGVNDTSAIYYCRWCDNLSQVSLTPVIKPWFSTIPWHDMSLQFVPERIHKVEVCKPIVSYRCFRMRHRH